MASPTPCSRRVILLVSLCFSFFFPTSPRNRFYVQDILGGWDIRSRYMVLAAACIVLACIVALILVLEESRTGSVVQETSSLDNTSTSGLNTRFAELLSRAEKLRWEGYDVYYIDYLLLSARYNYLRGYRDRAVKLLEEAETLLENASKLPSLPRIEFSISDNSLDLKKIPSTWDFVPLGTVFRIV